MANVFGIGWIDGIGYTQEGGASSSSSSTTPLTTATTITTGGAAQSMGMAPDVGLSSPSTTPMSALGATTTRPGTGMGLRLESGPARVTGTGISVNVNASGSDGAAAGAGGSSAMPIPQQGSAEGFFSLEEMEMEMGMGIGRTYFEAQGMGQGQQLQQQQGQQPQQHQRQGQHQPSQQPQHHQNQQHQLSLHFPSFVYAPSGPPMLIPGGGAEVVPLSSDAWCRWNGFQPLSLSASASAGLVGSSYPITSSQLVQLQQQGRLSNSQPQMPSVNTAQMRRSSVQQHQPHAQNHQHHHQHSPLQAYHNPQHQPQHQPQQNQHQHQPQYQHYDSPFLNALSPPETISGAPTPTPGPGHMSTPGRDEFEGYVGGEDGEGQGERGRMPFEFLDQEPVVDREHEHGTMRGKEYGFGWGVGEGVGLALGLGLTQAQDQAQARSGGHADAEGLGSGSGSFSHSHSQQQFHPLEPGIQNTTTTPSVMTRAAEREMEREMERGMGMGMEFDMGGNARVEDGAYVEALPGTRSVPAPGPRLRLGMAGRASMLLKGLSVGGAGITGTGQGQGPGTTRGQRAKDQLPLSSTRPLMIPTSSVASAISRMIGPTSNLTPNLTPTAATTIHLPTSTTMSNAMHTGSVPVSISMGFPVRGLPMAFNSSMGERRGSAMSMGERRESVVESGGSDGRGTPVGLLSPGVRQAGLQEMSRVIRGKNGGEGEGDNEVEAGEGESEVVPLPVEEVLGGEMWDGDEFEREGIISGDDNSNTSIVNVHPILNISANIKPPPAAFTIPRSLPMYSSTGFDVMGLLSRVVMRKHKRVDLGPVDMSCSFVVVDVRRHDAPIVYASKSFLELTGYAEDEVIGRNCRFLQGPPKIVGPLPAPPSSLGITHPSSELALTQTQSQPHSLIHSDAHRTLIEPSVIKGEYRQHTSNEAVAHLRKHLVDDKECQATLMNYRRDGTAFMNLVSVIPVRGGGKTSDPGARRQRRVKATTGEGEAGEEEWESEEDDDDDEVAYHVGFQVDLAEQPQAILEKMREGSWMRNYEGSRRVVEVGKRQRQRNQLHQHQHQGRAHPYPQTQRPQPGQGQQKRQQPVLSTVVMSDELKRVLRRWVKRALRSGKEGERWFEELGVPIGTSPLTSGPKESARRGDEGREDEAQSPSSGGAASSSSSAVPVNMPVDLDSPETPAENAVISSILHPTSPHTSHILHAIMLRYMPDLVHVVSLKGSFLYVGGSVEKLVGWGKEAGKVVGGAVGADETGEREQEEGVDAEAPRQLHLAHSGIADFAFKGDVVPLMRELKEGSVGVHTKEWAFGEMGPLSSGGDSANGNGGDVESADGGAGIPKPATMNANAKYGNMIVRPKSVDMLFRARTFIGSASSNSNSTSACHSSTSAAHDTGSATPVSTSTSNDRYVWIHSRGRLLVEPGKGRKAIILNGRVGDVWGVKWRDVVDAGGIARAGRMLVSMVPSTNEDGKEKGEEKERGRESGRNEGEDDERGARSKSRKGKERDSNEREQSRPPTAKDAASSPPVLRFVDVHTEFWAVLGGRGAGTTTFDWVGEGIVDIAGWERGEVTGRNVRRVFGNTAIEEGGAGDYQQAMKIERVVRALRKIQRNKRRGTIDLADDVLGEGEEGNRRWRKVRASMSRRDGGLVHVWVVVFRGDAEDEDEPVEVNPGMQSAAEPYGSGADVSYAPLFAQIRIVGADVCWNGTKEGERDVGPLLDASGAFPLSSGPGMVTFSVDSSPISSPSPSSFTSPRISTSDPSSTRHKPSSKSSPRLPNLFDILSTQRGTSWQYELQQRRFLAQRVKEELEKLERIDLALGGVEGCLWARQQRTAGAVPYPYGESGLGTARKMTGNMPRRMGVTSDPRDDGAFKHQTTFQRQGATYTNQNAQRMIEELMGTPSFPTSYHSQPQQVPMQKQSYNPFTSFSNLTSAPLPPPDMYENDLDRMAMPPPFGFPSPGMRSPSMPPPSHPMHSPGLSTHSTGPISRPSTIPPPQAYPPSAHRNMTGSMSMPPGFQAHQRGQMQTEVQMNTRNDLVQLHGTKRSWAESMGM